MNYDLAYYEKMLREYSRTAPDICRKRWTFLNENCEPVALKKEKARVLDYGSGVGWFRAFRPSWCDVWTYDIAQFPQTGIELQIYDCVCFWDVLEHIPDFREIEPILRLSDYAAVSLPIKPVGKAYFDWKHLKPKEHVHLFTEESLKALFEHYNYRTVIMSYMVECPPREDILTGLFKRGRT